MDVQDKILSAVLDTQLDIKELKGGVGHIEGIQEEAFDKLDGFLTLVDRHKAEIATLRFGERAS